MTRFTAALRHCTLLSTGLACWLLASSCRTFTSSDTSGPRIDRQQFPLLPGAVHRVTSSLDTQGRPANQSRAILLPGKVYLHSAWFNLPDREVTANIALLNPAGETVHSAESTFNPVHGRWISYTWYTFSAEDLPGVWRFEIIIDATPTSSREFLVRRAHNDTGSLPGNHRADMPSPIPGPAAGIDQPTAAQPSLQR